MPDPNTLGFGVPDPRRSGTRINVPPPPAPKAPAELPPGVKILGEAPAPSLKVIGDGWDPTAEEIYKMVETGKHVPDKKWSQIVYDYENKRSLGDKAAGVFEGAAAGAKGLLETLGGAVGEQFGHTDAAGKRHDAQIKKGYGLKTGANLLEGIGSAIVWNADMVRRAARNSYDFAAKATDNREEQIDRFHERWLANLQWDDLQNAPGPLMYKLNAAMPGAPAESKFMLEDWRKRVAEGEDLTLANQKNTQIGAAFLLDPSQRFLPTAALRVGKLGKLGKLAHGGASAMKDLAGKAVKGTAVGAAKGVQAAARGTRSVLGVPEMLVTKALDKIGPEATKIIKGMALPVSVPGQSILRSAQAGAWSVETAGLFAERLAKTSGSSQLPRLLQMAGDKTMPGWLRNLSRAAHGSGLGSVAGFGTDMAATSLKGAAHGAGLGLLTGERPEDIGHYAGFAAVLAPGTKALGKMVPRNKHAAQERAKRQLHDLQDFYAHLKEQGVSDPLIERIKTDQALTVSAIQGAFARQFLHKDVKFTFLERDSYNELASQGGEGSGSAAFFDPNSNRVVINADANRNALAHEVGHAAIKAAGATPQIRMEIDTIMSPAEVQAAAESYARQHKTTVAELNRLHQGDGWIYDEIFAEATFGALAGVRKGRDLPGEVLGVKSRIFDTWFKNFGDRQRAKLAEKMGFDLYQPGDRLFEGDKVYGPDMQRLVRGYLRSSAEGRGPSPEAKSGEPKGVPVPEHLIGKHPAAPVGTDFTVFDPVKQEVRMPSRRELNRVQRDRQKAVKAKVEDQEIRPIDDATDDIAPRGDVEGNVEIRGRAITDFIKDLPQFGDEARKSARILEGAMPEGGVVKLWYQAVGHGHGWKSHVRSKLANISVSEIEFAPYDAFMSKPGNLLVRGLSLTAMERRIQEWVDNPKSPLHTAFNHKVEMLRQDLATYIRNHHEGREGAHGIGEGKRDALNFFLIGGNKKFAHLNPFRESARGNDKVGIIRSLRLDRMANVKPTDQTMPAHYGLKVQNFSPDIGAPAPRPSPVSAREAREEALGRAVPSVQPRPVQQDMFREPSALPDVKEPPTRVQRAQRAYEGGKYGAGFDNWTLGDRLSVDRDRVHAMGNVKDAAPAANPRKAGKRDTATGVKAEMPPEVRDATLEGYEKARQHVLKHPKAPIVRDLLAEVWGMMQFNGGKNLSKEMRDFFVKPMGEARISTKDEVSQGMAKDTRRPRTPGVQDDAAVEAMRLVTEILTAPKISAEFMASLPPKVRALVKRARRELPMISPDSQLGAFLLWKPEGRSPADNPHRTRFMRLANASEGPVLLDTDTQWVYKAIGPSFHLANIEGKPTYEALTVQMSSIFDMMNKIDRQSRIPGGLPMEILGLLPPRGQSTVPSVVVRMPRMERDAFKHEAQEWLSNHWADISATTRRSGKGLDINPAAIKDQPIMRDEHWNSYASADVRENYSGDYPNFMADKNGNVLMMDVMLRPIDQADVNRDPALAQYTPEQPNKILYSPDIPEFSSRLDDAVDSLKQEKVSLEQLRAHLAKTTSPEEVEWRGLNDQMALWERDGLKSVSKSDIQLYLKDHPFALTETVRGGDARAGASWQGVHQDVTDPALRAVGMQREFEALNLSLRVQVRLMLTDDGYVVPRVDTKPGWQSADLGDASVVDIVADIRDMGARRRFLHSHGAREAVEDILHKHRAPLPKAPEVRHDSGSLRVPGPFNNYRETTWQVPGRPDLPAKMSRAHWGSDPNVVAHSRTTDRGAGDVRLLEEVQSDWHQQGKKYGYVEKPPAPLKLPEGYTLRSYLTPGNSLPFWTVDGPRAIRDPETIPTLRAETAVKNFWRRRFQDVADASNLHQMSPEAKDAYFAGRPELDPAWKDLEVARDHFAEVRRHLLHADEIPGASDSKGEVPDAPFKGNAWVEMVLRRELQRAAAEGKKYLALTTGEQQADRYNLSKHVESLELRGWDPDTGGTIIGRKGNRVVVDKNVTSREELSAQVGEEIAGKLLKQTSGADAPKVPKLTLEHDSGTTSTKILKDGEMFRVLYSRNLAEKFLERLINFQEGSPDRYPYADKLTPQEASKLQVPGPGPWYGVRVAPTKGGWFARKGSHPLIPGEPVSESNPTVAARATAYRESLPPAHAPKVTGDDLKVGGLGMKGFYDQVLPNLLKKVARKFDKSARVTEIEIEGPGRVDYTVPALEITPAMREKLSGKGVPAFSPDIGSKDPSGDSGDMFPKAKGFKSPRTAVAEKNKEARLMVQTHPELIKPKIARDKETNKPIQDKHGNAKFVKMTPQFRKTKAFKDHGPEKAVEVVGEKLAGQVEKALNDPQIREALVWYEKIREQVRDIFGFDSDQMFQYLAGTSSITDVVQNFKNAWEAISEFSKGSYDEIIPEYLAHKEAGKPDSEFLNRPKKSNGALFGVNSMAVVRVMAGLWLEKAGQKTHQFFDNMSGRDSGATIDVWASRTARRIAMEGVKKWRIPPAVEGAPGAPDFRTAQAIFKNAADRLGMEPEQIQAAAWFMEKKLWDQKGWTKGEGRSLSSFSKELAKKQDEAPIDRMLGGITTFKDGVPFDRRAHEKTRRELRADLRKVEGLVSLRVNRSRGYWFEKIKDDEGNPVLSEDGKEEMFTGIEPNFDVQAVFHNEKAWEAFERAIYDAAQKSPAPQSAHFASRIVSQDHPNARPGVEIFFRQRLSKAKAQAVMQIFAESGLQGFSTVSDSKGQVTGFWAQYIPEFNGHHTEEAQVEGMAQFNGQIDAAVKKMDKNNILWVNKRHYDTRVFREKEEFTPGGRKTSLEQEMARDALYRERRKAASDGTEAKTEPGEGGDRPDG